MDDLKNNKMLWALIIVTIFNIGAFLMFKVVVDKAAERVEKKLKKEYSPSPYGPGFDPDKVSPEAFKSSMKSFDSNNGQSKVFVGEKAKEIDGKIYQTVLSSDAWRSEWEGSRINP